MDIWDRVRAELKAVRAVSPWGLPMNPASWDRLLPAGPVGVVDYLDDGWRAHRAGVPRDLCPMVPESCERAEWLLGWDRSARALARAKLRG